MLGESPGKKMSELETLQVEQPTTARRTGHPIVASKAPLQKL
jgi:hypothetical protein